MIQSDFNDFFLIGESQPIKVYQKSIGIVFWFKHREIFNEQKHAFVTVDIIKTDFQKKKMTDELKIVKLIVEGWGKFELFLLG